MYNTQAYEIEKNKKMKLLTKSDRREKTAYNSPTGSHIYVN